MLWHGKINYSCPCYLKPTDALPHRDSGYSTPEPLTCCSCKEFIRPAKLCQVVFHPLQSSGQTSPIILLPVKAWLLWKHPGVENPPLGSTDPTAYSTYCMRECRCWERTVLCHIRGKKKKKKHQNEANCLILGLALHSLQCNSRTDFEKITSIILLMLKISS